MELIEIFGSKGTLKVDFQNKLPFSYQPKKLGRNLPIKRITNTTIYDINTFLQHNLINYFIDSILNNKQEKTDFNDGKKAVKFVLKAYSLKK
jgi:predicted dehydrogenase